VIDLFDRGQRLLLAAYLNDHLLREVVFEFKGSELGQLGGGEVFVPVQLLFEP